MIEEDTCESTLDVFPPGSVVQVRSGGPLLTVIRTESTGYVTSIYHNAVTGLFESCYIHQSCLRIGSSVPSVPESANQLRHTPVTSRSSL